MIISLFPITFCLVICCYSNITAKNKMHKENDSFFKLVQEHMMLLIYHIQGSLHDCNCSGRITIFYYRYPNRTSTLHTKIHYPYLLHKKPPTFLICHTGWHSHTQPKEKPNLNRLQLKQRSWYSYVQIFNLGFLFLPKRPFRRLCIRCGISIYKSDTADLMEAQAGQ